MNKPSTIDVMAMRQVRGENETWIGIDCLDEFLALDDVRMVDAALAFASATLREAELIRSINESRWHRRR